MTQSQSDLYNAAALHKDLLLEFLNWLKWRKYETNLLTMSMLHDGLVDEFLAQRKPSSG